jgi:hypothetical protein
VVELDKEFWTEHLAPLTKKKWADRQTSLAAASRWIMDGDLGPYDVLEPRLRRADTVVVLDLPFWLCAWRARRRGPERREFWVWTMHWRRDSRQRLLDAVAANAPTADVIVLRNRRSTRRWLGSHLRLSQ